MLPGKTIRYTEVGTGDVPVVMLHGLFGGPENWRDVMENLGDMYRLIAPQFPIDPQPDRCHTDFRGIDQLTDYVQAVLDHLNVDRAILCGNSLGGQVAADFCLRNPDRADRLVITGSAGLFERNVVNGMRFHVNHAMVHEWASQVFHEPAHVSNDLVDNVCQMLADRKYVRFVIRVAKATRNRNMKEELGLLKLPTLIIWGKNDQITPPSVGREFLEAIPNAQLAFIDRCGHSPPIEKPLEFARILKKFLATPIPASPVANPDPEVPVDV